MGIGVVGVCKYQEFLGMLNRTTHNNKKKKKQNNNHQQCFEINAMIPSAN